MSHFTTLKTQFVSRTQISAALGDVAQQFGLGLVRSNTTVNGYRGNSTPAELVVGTRNAGYDIGFRRAGDTYEMVADWWGIKDFKQEAFTQRLQQRYAYHAVRDQLDQSRFTLVEERVEADDTIRLLVRRVG